MQNPPQAKIFTRFFGIGRIGRAPLYHCFMVKEWEGIPDSVIKNLIGSMRKCCEAVIERGGERISY